MIDESIETFWLTLAELEDNLARTKPEKQAMKDVLATLQDIDPRLFFHVGMLPDGPDLVLSAEGHADLLHKVRELAEVGPELPGWRYITVPDSSLVMGKRNTLLFPNDSTGDALYELAMDGDNLCIPRTFEFASIFPTMEAAQAFAEGAKGLQLLSEVSQYAENPQYPWQAITSKLMMPTHAEVSWIQNYLGTIVEQCGGYSDGWSCEMQPHEERFQ